MVLPEKKMHLYMFGKSLMYGIDVYILHQSYQVKYHVVKKYDSSLDKKETTKLTAKY